MKKIRAEKPVEVSCPEKCGMRISESDGELTLNTVGVKRRSADVSAVSVVVFNSGRDEFVDGIDYVCHHIVAMAVGVVG